MKKERPTAQRRTTAYPRTTIKLHASVAMLTPYLHHRRTEYRTTRHQAKTTPIASCMASARCIRSQSTRLFNARLGARPWELLLLPTTRAQVSVMDESTPNRLLTLASTTIIQRAPHRTPGSLGWLHPRPPLRSDRLACLIILTLQALTL